jgi:uncharacterized protein (DUF736 family)
METKNNSGAIFKNAKKTNEKQPDYQGTVNVNGKEMQISMWLKESQKGVKYFSVAFKEPYVKQNTNTGNFMPNDFRIDSHDDLF